MRISKTRMDLEYFKNMLPGKITNNQEIIRTPVVAELCDFGTLAERMFIERWIGALQVLPRF